VLPDDRSAHLLTEARRHDPDRYLCALLAPAARREAVLTLILFNHELARIPDIVTQPMAGMIRLQWWREAIDELAGGRPARRHPVVDALGAVLAEGVAAPDALHALIDAREPALEPIAPELGALESYAAATSGALQALIYAALGGTDPALARAAREIGAALGLVRLADAVRGEAETAPAAQEATAALRLAARARAAALLHAGRDGAGRPPRDQMAAFLPAGLTDAYLRQLANGAELRRPAAMPLLLAARSVLRRP
jgi:phytoene synthase